MKAGLAHGARFIASGLIAFSTDMAVLWFLTRKSLLDPYSARLVAIAVAMVVAYFAHRRLSFDVADPPSLAQFAKFASVAGMANALNYVVYAGTLLSIEGSTPVTALLAATVVATGASYIGFRFGVFRKPG